jgi:hypothetical protein
MTFVDYLDFKWHREPTEKELKSIANIISWNLWQMDGLKGTVPVKPKEENVQLSLMDFFEEKPEQESISQKCRIFDWRKDSSILFESLKEK